MAVKRSRLNRHLNNYWAYWRQVADNQVKLPATNIPAALAYQDVIFDNSDVTSMRSNNRAASIVLAEGFPGGQTGQIIIPTMVIIETEAKATPVAIGNGGMFISTEVTNAAAGRVDWAPVADDIMEGVANQLRSAVIHVPNQVNDQIGIGALGGLPITLRSVGTPSSGEAGNRWRVRTFYTTVSYQVPSER